MKVLYGMFSQETNSFSFEKTDFERLICEGWFEGDKIYSTYKDTDTYLGGMLDIADKNNIEMVPTVAVATAGPTITEACLMQVVDQIVSIAKANKADLSGVCFALHGAGCAQNVPSIEIYTLEAIRAVLGPEIPIMVSLDLHANIPERLLELTDGIFGIKEYPHIDTRAAGVLSMQALVNRLTKNTRYHKYLVKIPLLIPCLGGGTLAGPMKSIKEYIDNFSRGKGLFDATLFHGFPYSDQPHTAASILVISEQSADKEALELAEYVWAHRESIMVRSISVKEAVDKALTIVKEQNHGYTIIAEASDNAGGGAPANGTHLIKELLDRSTSDFPRCIFGAIYDPNAAKLANKAGVGGHIQLYMGGFTDKIHGDPVFLEDAEILAVSNGRSTFLSPVMGSVPCDLGLCARLRVKNLEIIVISVRMQTFDDRPFLLTGADINQYSIIALKSTHHFRGWFENRANNIVITDPPGIQTANFSLLPFKNIIKPIYPLDKNFQPKLRVQEISKFEGLE